MQSWRWRGTWLIGASAMAMFAACGGHGGSGPDTTPATGGSLQARRQFRAVAGVAVLPSAGGRKASFYVNHRVPESQVPDLINPTSGRYEDSIIQDLIPAIENTILKGRVRQ
jgi:hypothetical protein